MKAIDHRQRKQAIRGQALTLPTFLIIGAARAGTTYLYHLLRQHPDIYMSPIKETNFFAYDEVNPGARLWRIDSQLNDFPVRSLGEYEALFEEVNDEVAVGEASPLYLESLFAPERIKKTIPDVKLVVSLRNPAVRAYSDYIMQVKWGHRKIWRRKINGFQEHEVRIGYYFELLRRYYDLFDAGQIKVIIFEEWTDGLLKALPKLFEFLGVDPAYAPDPKHRKNEGQFPRSLLLHYALIDIKRVFRGRLPPLIKNAVNRLFLKNLGKPPPFPPELREKMVDTYRPDISRLGDLIGRDLSLWLK